MIEAWNWFFHARAGPKACVIAGWARIAFAILILADKALLTVDFHWFFLSGRMPYEATSKDPDQEGLFTILSLAPESPLLYWTMHILTMVVAFLLLLGIMPRLMVVLLHIGLLTFHHHNGIMWDGEDAMFRVWNALFLFLPLHRVTIYEWMGKLKKEQKEMSWPMWPFRLWQIEICYIYLGAGFGKLASERWQNGTAMYHVIHITDFFGGAFAPEILYNRIGPLQLMTYSSVAVECLCVLFIWPLESRMITFWLIMALHIGIELSMNMHCFEWLAMLGWLFFLVKPQKELSYKPSNLFSLVLTVALIIVALDTLPIDEFMDVTPETVHLPFEYLAEWRHYTKELFVHPFLTPIGLSQSVWNMFCAAPDEVFVFDADVRFNNGTTTKWHRPQWDDQSWLEKKRWQRPMTYFDTIADGYSWPIMESVVRGIAMDCGPETASVQLTVYTDQPPELPPAHLGFWDVAKQPRVRTNSKRLFSLNICDDLDIMCEEWADKGYCSNYDNWLIMMDRCKKRCGFCYDTTAIRVNQRIAIRWLQDGEYYTATVLEIKNDRYFYVEYDDYEFDYERYEWLDRVDLRQRKFKILQEEEDPEMEAPTPYTPETNIHNEVKGHIPDRPIKLDVRVERKVGLPLKPQHLGRPEHNNERVVQEQTDVVEQQQQQQQQQDVSKDEL